MGLLDDAIKEHLDLKRRHGADAGEVARQESEALGPVRREVEPAAEENLPAAAPFDAEGESKSEPPAPEAADAPEPDPSAEAGEPAGQPTEHFDVLAQDDADADESRKPAAPGDELFEPGEEPFADEPAQPAREAPADPPDREDVLEETPEFLQETPEHDRLWFEQKPPKDFDFDE